MAKGKGGHLYDEDDYYDYDDDYDEEEVVEKPPPKSKAGTKGAAAPAAAAGASKLAQFLCDPPPLRENGKMQKGVRKDPAAVAKHQALAAAPVGRVAAAVPAPAGSAGRSGGSGPAAAAAAPPQPFRFNTPSPDDRVRAAQQSSTLLGGPDRAPPPGFPSLPKVLQQRDLPAASTSAASGAAGPSGASSTAALAPATSAANAADAVLAMFGLNMSGRGATASSATAASGTGAPMPGVVSFGPPGGAGAPAAAEAAAVSAAAAGQQAGPSGSSEAGVADGQGSSRVPRPARKVAEYKMEADLARACEAAATAERVASAAGASTSGAPAASSFSSLPRLHLVVLGHVDAGKSTLMGRLLHDLGHVSQKEAHRNQKEATQAGKGSFAWAWVLDERPEERARGVTVDVATARFTTPRFAVTLLDAPGHRDFVPNMISGAAQADAALLVVDGSPGGFESGFEGSGGEHSGGQTKEHAQLARSLGIDQVTVVVTKLDMCDFSQTRFEEVRAALAPFLQTVGFKASRIQWLPAVGPSGQNLTQPPTEVALRAWWPGRTLVQAVDNFAPRERQTGKPLRMPVSDVFKSRTGGLVVGGKLEGGALRPGAQVLLMPSQEVATVKSIEVDGQVVGLARAGDSADVTLTGIDMSALSSGSVLCHMDFPVPMVVTCEVLVLVLDVPIPLMPGAQVTVHAHTAREAGRISGLLRLVHPKTNETLRLKPRCVSKGQTAVVEVTLGRSMCLEEYADFRALGRVALRDCGRTIAVGLVQRIVG